MNHSFKTELVLCAHLEESRMFQFLRFHHAGRRGEILMPFVLLTMIVFIKARV